MKKLKLIITLVIILSVSLLTLLTKPSPSNICFQSSSCFDIEIAQTPETRSQGLMFRESLPQNQGMLFIFPKSEIYSFWMKNTLIPLDIIWISENLEIIDITTLSPCIEDPCPSYTPKAQAKYVLEINANLAQQQNIKIGDHAIITLEN